MTSSGVSTNSDITVTAYNNGLTTFKLVNTSVSSTDSVIWFINNQKLEQNSNGVISINRNELVINDNNFKNTSYTVHIAAIPQGGQYGLDSTNSGSLTVNVNSYDAVPVGQIASNNQTATSTHSITVNDSQNLTFSTPTYNNNNGQNPITWKIQVGDKTQYIPAKSLTNGNESINRILTSANVNTNSVQKIIITPTQPNASGQPIIINTAPDPITTAPIVSIDSTSNNNLYHTTSRTTSSTTPLQVSAYNQGKVVFQISNTPIPPNSKVVWVVNNQVADASEVSGTNDDTLTILGSQYTNTSSYSVKAYFVPDDGQYNIDGTASQTINVNLNNNDTAPIGQISSNNQTVTSTTTPVPTFNDNKTIKATISNWTNSDNTSNPITWKIQVGSQKSFNISGNDLSTGESISNILQQAGVSTDSATSITFTPMQPNATGAPITINTAPSPFQVAPQISYTSSSSLTSVQSETLTPVSVSSSAIICYSTSSVTFSITNTSDEPKNATIVWTVNDNVLSTKYASYLSNNNTVLTIPGNSALINGSTSYTVQAYFVSNEGNYAQDGSASQKATVDLNNYDAAPVGQVQSNNQTATSSSPITVSDNNTLTFNTPNYNDNNGQNPITWKIQVGNKTQYTPTKSLKNNSESINKILTNAGVNTNSAQKITITPMQPNAAGKPIIVNTVPSAINTIPTVNVISSSTNQDYSKSYNTTSNTTNTVDVIGYDNGSVKFTISNTSIPSNTKIVWVVNNEVVSGSEISGTNGDTLTISDSSSLVNSSSTYSVKAYFVPDSGQYSIDGTSFATIDVNVNKINTIPVGQVTCGDKTVISSTTSTPTFNDNSTIRATVSNWSNSDNTSNPITWKVQVGSQTPIYIPSKDLSTGESISNILKQAGANTNSATSITFTPIQPNATGASITINTAPSPFQVAPQISYTSSSSLTSTQSETLTPVSVSSSAIIGYSTGNVTFSITNTSDEPKSGNIVWTVNGNVLPSSYKSYLSDNNTVLTIPGNSSLINKAISYTVQAYFVPDEGNYAQDGSASQKATVDLNNYDTAPVGQVQSNNQTATSSSSIAVTDNNNLKFSAPDYNDNNEQNPITWKIQVDNKTQYIPAKSLTDGSESINKILTNVGVNPDSAQRITITPMQPNASGKPIIVNTVPNAISTIPTVKIVSSSTNQDYSQSYNTTSDASNSVNVTAYNNGSVKFTISNTTIPSNVSVVWVVNGHVVSGSDISGTNNDTLSISNSSSLVNSSSTYSVKAYFVPDGGKYNIDGTSSATINVDVNKIDTAPSGEITGPNNVTVTNSTTSTPTFNDSSTIKGSVPNWNNQNNPITWKVQVNNTTPFTISNQDMNNSQSISNILHHVGLNNNSIAKITFTPVQPNADGKPIVINTAPAPKISAKNDQYFTQNQDTNNTLQSYYGLNVTFTLTNSSEFNVSGSAATITWYYKTNTSSSWTKIPTDWIVSSFSNNDSIEIANSHFQASYEVYATVLPKSSSSSQINALDSNITNITLPTYSSELIAAPVVQGVAWSTQKTIYLKNNYVIPTSLLNDKNLSVNVTNNAVTTYGIDWVVTINNVTKYISTNNGVLSASDIINLITQANININDINSISFKAFQPNQTVTV